ncbi:hypothetical protein G7067_07575 [Leucobacter insecticola]|uniref:Addiction module protein n=1 Tax=Leucobacter insecticola TaxID=2714934 RepID=A0A6G8FIX4_9MICO|nr:hypothetical protein [Leucobacter insecticola]QIM16314.1 hypothetical protein G7067_07575 [Leucobacter insecticola]
MNPHLTEYIERGKSLDADEREIAALALQRVDAEEQADIDAAWDQVISRRLEEVIDGSARLVDGRDGLARIRSELAARRK